MDGPTLQQTYENIANEYHQKCDQFDQRTCSLDMGTGGVFPIDEEERAKCVDNAKKLYEKYKTKIPEGYRYMLTRQYPPV